LGGVFVLYDVSNPDKNLDNNEAPSNSKLPICSNANDKRKLKLDTPSSFDMDTDFNIF
jgi:hypothetical protein